MDRPQLSRRNFLMSAASAAGASWLGAHWGAVLAAAADAGAARDAAAPFELLAADDAADLAAIAAQILPTDARPGATEAGVVYFMDIALRTFMVDDAEPVARGLQALNAKAGARFATLPAADQERLLRAEESTPFFDTVRFMTIAGMFALPAYGGNRGRLGWKLLAFDHRHAWTPPFGHYDASAVKPGGKP